MPPSAAPTQPGAGVEHPPWHAVSAEHAAHRLEVDPARGLSAAEAQARLDEYGPNRLAAKAPRRRP